MSLATRRKWLKEQGHRLKRTPADLKVLYEYLATRKPISGMIEIGCYHGGSLYTLAERVEKGSVIIGVDLFGKDRKERKGKTIKTAKKMLSEGYDIHIIQGDSRRVWVDTRELLKGRKVGLLHIDGGHSYEVARADFDNYSPFVADGGVVIIHDVCNTDCGVPKVWAELKEQYGDRAIQRDDLLGRDSGAILL